MDRRLPRSPVRRSPLRGGFRQPADRATGPRRVSRIPTLSGSLAGPSGRFRESFQSDYGWNRSVDTRAEAQRARDPNELASDAFEGADPQKHPYKFVKAPWWHHRLVEDDRECSRFAVDHMLPGNLPLAAIRKREWRMYAAISVESLRTRFTPHRTRAQILELTKESHIKATAQAFELTRESQIIPANLPIDCVYYRHHGDREYVARLMVWSRDNNALGVTNSDRSEPGSVVSTDIMAGTLLPANFRYVLRKDAASTSINHFRSNAFDQARYERRVRKKFGYLIPHERKEIWRIKQERQSHLYVPPPPEWSNLELPAGFHVPLPSVLAYKTTDLSRTYGSPFWVVFYADWAAQVAAAWLWEIYSTSRLWHLPKLVFLLIQELWDGLAIPLGGERNLAELHSWMEMLRRIDWDNPADVPAHWNCRTHREEVDIPCVDNRFKGRDHETCGDFVFVHPWEHIRLTADEKHEYQSRGRPYQPRGHPTGYIVIDAERSNSRSQNPPRGRSSPQRSSARTQEQHRPDPNVLHIRFRQDPAGTVNIDPIPEDVRELVIQEFAHDIGLFQRSEHPVLEEICDRLVAIILAPEQGMRSAFYRRCIAHFLYNVGVTHPVLVENTNPKSFFEGLIAARVQYAQANNTSTDVEMADTANTAAPSVSTAVLSASNTGHAPAGGNSSQEGPAPINGAIPEETGGTPVSGQLPSSPSNGDNSQAKPNGASDKEITAKPNEITTEKQGAAPAAAGSSKPSA